MDEAIKVSCIFDKVPHSWKDFKHTLKHQKEELTLVELDSHLRIKESLKTHEELTEKEVKQMEADDQAIQTVLKGLPKDIYDAVDSYETA
ncbi:hypothetical protein Tco_0971864 [Tanacetum coccineum]